MKRAIFITLVFVSFVFISMSQTKPTEVAPDGWITKPVYAYVFGTTADTITDAANKTFVYRVKGNQTQDYDFKLYLDHVSGTAGGSLVLLKSYDGVGYEATAVGDTLTFSSVTADGLQAGFLNLNDFNAPYLGIKYIQTGTAVTVPRVYLITRRN
jgi:hypothetical protein